MTSKKFIKKLLRLKDLRVTHFEFQERRKILYIWVKPYKNGCLCPECNRRCHIIRLMPKVRTWKDLPICGYIVMFLYQPKEIFCPTHGRVQEVIPWADAYAHVTYRFEYAMLTYCQIMTQKVAAQLLKIPNSTLSDILHRTINRIRDGHRVRGLKSIGVDEISYCKGHKYATIVYDLDRSRVVWVGKGKGRKTIDSFFNEQLSQYQKAQIQLASCDMSQTYINAIEDHCPNVTLVLDRFHIVKALNEAVDDVRKEQWRNASGDERKSLKGLRWLLFKHSTKRSKEDTLILKSLSKANRRIHRAWILKDEFEQLWNFTKISKAKEFLKGWITTALKSRIGPIRQFVQTIKLHIDRIVPFVETHLTNAKAEGLNRIIKIVKNRASGFRTLEAFTDLIFLTVGDVNIPAQIPKRFRRI
jgi:transposase